MDQSITLHIVISNLVNSINPTFSLYSYPHFLPYGMDIDISSIFFYLVSILLKTIFISHSKNVENRDVEKGKRIRPYRTRETLFVMEVEG